MNSRTRSTVSRTVGIVFTIGIGALLALPAAAQAVPTMVNYQGRLTDNTPQQDPINGTLPMDFKIYGSQMGSDLLWSESWSGVQVVDGIFSVLLGDNGSPVPSSVFVNGTTRYLEVTVNGETLTPRQRIASVGYSNQAASALDVTGVNCVDSTEVEFNYADSTSEGGPAVDIECANCVSAGEVQFNYAGATSKGGPASNLACTDCVSAGEVQFPYAGSTSEGGPASNLACTNCVSASEVQFNYAGATSEGGPASDLGCANCVSSDEIVNDTITNADISAAAGISPTKISGTAWTSANDGPGSGLDADLLDGVTAGNFQRIREIGVLDAFVADSHTLVIPHYATWTLELASGWPDMGGVARVMGLENDRYHAITYTKYNGDGTSASGGAECPESSTNVLLTFGSGSHVYTLRCPGEASGDRNLVLTKPASAVEMKYKLLW